MIVPYVVPGVQVEPEASNAQFASGATAVFGFGRPSADETIEAKTG